MVSEDADTFFHVQGRNDEIMGLALVDRGRMLTVVPQADSVLTTVPTFKKSERQTHTTLLSVSNLIAAMYVNYTGNNADIIKLLRSSV